MSKDGDGFNAGVTLGVFTSLIVISLFFTIMFWGDTNDSIDTRALGKILCKQQGLDYSHRTWLDCHSVNATCLNPVPVIHCKEFGYSKLVDGVIVKDD